MIINDETGEAFKSPKITMAIQAMAKHNAAWNRYIEIMNPHRLRKEVVIKVSS